MRMPELMQRLRSIGRLVFTKQFPSEFDTLRMVELFTGDRIRAAGMMPPHITAWRRLLMHERADECFKQLIDSATLAGQLYGLAGVYFTDHASFAELAAPYRVHKGTVETIFTCIVGNTPVSKIVDQIESGALPAELRGNPQRLEFPFLVRKLER